MIIRKVLTAEDRGKDRLTYKFCWFPRILTNKEIVWLEYVCIHEKVILDYIDEQLNGKYIWVKVSVKRLGT